MIQAMIFDLDATLVQTEKLKALSYAKAAIDLCPHAGSEGEVIEAFKSFVGLPRRKVAEDLVDRFALEPKAIACMEEFGVSAPWQAFVQVRLSHYERMLADPQAMIGQRRQTRWN